MRIVDVEPKMGRQSTGKSLRTDFVELQMCLFSGSQGIPGGLAPLRFHMQNTY
jgi:hypothetical protein